MSYRKKLKLLSAKDYSFFLGSMYFSSDDGYQNMLAHQTAFSVLGFKKDKGNEYAIY